jgi:hypothetical protein
MRSQSSGQSGLSAHHIAHQLAPVADASLRVLGTDFASVAQTRKEPSLF